MHFHMTGKYIERQSEQISFPMLYSDQICQIDDITQVYCPHMVKVKGR